MPEGRSSAPITGPRLQTSKNSFETCSWQRSGARVLRTYHSTKSCFSVTLSFNMAWLLLQLLAEPGTIHSDADLISMRKAGFGNPGGFRADFKVGHSSELPWGGCGVGLGVSELLRVLILGLDWTTSLHCVTGFSFCGYSRMLWCDYGLSSTVLDAGVSVYSGGLYYQRL